MKLRLRSLPGTTWRWMTQEVLRLGWAYIHPLGYEFNWIVWDILIRFSLFRCWLSRCCSIYFGTGPHRRRAWTSKYPPFIMKFGKLSSCSINCSESTRISFSYIFRSACSATICAYSFPQSISNRCPLAPLDGKAPGSATRRIIY